MKMTIYGRRATAIHDRRRAGTEDGAIADEIGMSVKMVSRYLRFADKTASPAPAAIAVNERCPSLKTLRGFETFSHVSL